VALGFGFDFVPLYLHHPDVESVSVCNSNPALLKRVADQFNVSRRAADLNEILADDQIDAVHLLTPVPLHEPHIMVYSSASFVAASSSLFSV